MRWPKKKPPEPQPSAVTPTAPTRPPTWGEYHLQTKLAMLRYLEGTSDGDPGPYPMVGWTFAECCRMNHALNKIGEGRLNLEAKWVGGEP